MANEVAVTVVGNVANEPELRFIPSGKAVVSFTVVQNNRVKDGDGWKDGEPTFFRCNAWEGMAENIAESLTKGMNVIVTGGMYTRAWEDREKNKRTSLELRVEAIGPNLRRATAKVQKVSSSAPAQRVQGGDDPWAQHAPAQGFEESPPF